MMAVVAAELLGLALACGARAQDSSIMQELDRQQEQVLQQLRDAQRRGDDRRDDRQRLDRQDAVRRDDLRREDLRRDEALREDRRRLMDEEDRRARDRGR